MRNVRNPLISVIVPVYNVEQYLGRCVESIRRQNYQNLEIILVDDGSPDRCGELCEILAKEDSRIKVIHKVNGGLSSARNAGLDAMTGEYVCFVDSDDWILPEMVETLYRRMEQENAQISCCGIGRYEGEKLLYCMNRNVEEKFTLDRKNAHRELLQNQTITNSVCDKLYRAEIFQGLRLQQGILYEDMQVQPQCLERAQRVTYTGEPLYCYHVSQGSILGTQYNLHHYDAVAIAMERMEFYSQRYPELVAMARAALINQSIAFIYQAYHSPACDEKRLELTKMVCQPLDAQTAACCGRNLRVKRVLLKIHPQVLILAEGLYGWLRKLWG